FGSRSKTVSRACSSFRVETNPAGLYSMIVSGGATRTSSPSTLTWSSALGCALKFVQTLPLMVTRLAAINSSQCRRDPTPAAARKRLRRKNELQEYQKLNHYKGAFFLRFVTLFMVHFRAKA